MIQTVFYVGSDWWVMGSIGIGGERDLNDVYYALLAVGCPNDEAQKACMVLSRKNSGYTYTDMERQFTLMFASETDTAEEMFDTIIHELKHMVEHISDCYGVSPKSEEAAYLQGEIARKLFPSVVIAVCPVCHDKINAASEE